ncbi:peroxisomal sarcosine oxidase-like [Cloeon dipterum]|uniref:peroxisomal sarcosine oxidase-like n=1 Tax=Cloeon dipterum TaxID=197152 RepID=UPI0032203A48
MVILMCSQIVERMEHFQYIVVGAGIEGSWAAYQIVRDEEKPSVLLLEQYHLPHNRGSSHGQSRIIRHAYAESFQAALMPYSYKEWRKLEKDAGVDLLVTKPLLCVSDETGYERMDRTLACLKELKEKPGYDVAFKELSPAELAANFPQAKFPNNRRAFVEYSAGILYADKCLMAVQNQFRKHGGVIRDGFEVTRIIPGKIVVIEGVCKGRTVKLTADKVALCPGPWAKKMVEPLLKGIRLPLKVYRVPVYYWKVKKNGPGVITAIYKDLGAGDFWSIPEIEYKDLVKYSSNLILYEIDPDKRDLNAEQTQPPQLARHLRDHFPGMEETPSILETCIYTSTPDEVFILDIIPDSANIAYACGFSGSGFKKAPSVGLMLKEILKPQTKMSFDETPFSVSRFMKSQL